MVVTLWGPMCPYGAPYGAWGDVAVSVSLWGTPRPQLCLCLQQSHPWASPWKPGVLQLIRRTPPHPTSVGLAGSPSPTWRPCGSTAGVTAHRDSRRPRLRIGARTPAASVGKPTGTGGAWSTIARPTRRGSSPAWSARAGTPTWPPTATTSATTRAVKRGCQRRRRPSGLWRRRRRKGGGGSSWQ